MHARFGSEPTIRIFTNKFNARRFNAGHIPIGYLKHLCFKAFIFTPAQIHPQNDRGPILSFRSAGSGLNIDIGIRAIHLTAKHALKLKALDEFGALIKIESDQ